VCREDRLLREDWLLRELAAASNRARVGKSDELHLPVMQGRGRAATCLAGAGKEETRLPRSYTAVGSSEAV
jgi:hypothetical protein